MKIKLDRIDVILVSVLFFLIALEFFIKRSELSHTQVILGIVIGFSVGFKLSAVHGSAVSRQAMELIKEKESRLDRGETEKIHLEKGYEVELERKQKLINKLNANLMDRDEEIKQLCEKLQDKS